MVPKMMLAITQTIESSIETRNIGTASTEQAKLNTLHLDGLLDLPPRDGSSFIGAAKGFSSTTPFYSKTRVEESCLVVSAHRDHPLTDGAVRLANQREPWRG